jgi:hypothetical protein
MYGIELDDFDGDGLTDILLGGNFYKSKPEVGRYDATYGVLLKGDGRANFKALSANESGIKMDGEVRDIVTIQSGKEKLILVARNNDTVVTYKAKRK